MAAGLQYCVGGVVSQFGLYCLPDEGKLFYYRTFNPVFSYPKEIARNASAANLKFSVAYLRGVFKEAPNSPVKVLLRRSDIELEGSPIPLNADIQEQIKHMLDSEFIELSCRLAWPESVPAKAPSNRNLLEEKNNKPASFDFEQLLSAFEALLPEKAVTWPTLDENKSSKLDALRVSISKMDLKYKSDVLQARYRQLDARYMQALGNTQFDEGVAHLSVGDGSVGYAEALKKIVTYFSAAYEIEPPKKGKNKWAIRLAKKLALDCMGTHFQAAISLAKIVKAFYENQKDDKCLQSFCEEFEEKSMQLYGAPRRALVALISCARKDLLKKRMRGVSGEIAQAAQLILGGASSHRKILVSIAEDASQEHVRRAEARRDRARTIMAEALSDQVIEVAMSELKLEAQEREMRATLEARKMQQIQSDVAQLLDEMIARLEDQKVEVAHNDSGAAEPGPEIKPGLGDVQSLREENVRLRGVIDSLQGELNMARYSEADLRQANARLVEALGFAQQQVNRLSACQVPRSPARLPVVRVTMFSSAVRSRQLYLYRPRRPQASRQGPPQNRFVLRPPFGSG